jgi:hypothetical protein
MTPMPSIHPPSIHPPSIHELIAQEESRSSIFRSDPHDRTAVLRILQDWKALEKVYQALTRAEYPWQNASLHPQSDKLGQAVDAVKRVRGER